MMSDQQVFCTPEHQLRQHAGDDNEAFTSCSEGSAVAVIASAETFGRHIVVPESPEIAARRQAQQLAEHVSNYNNSTMRSWIAGTASRSSSSSSSAPASLHDPFDCTPHQSSSSSMSTSGQSVVPSTPLAPMVMEETNTKEVPVQEVLQEINTNNAKSKAQAALMLNKPPSKDKDQHKTIFRKTSHPSYKNANQLKQKLARAEIGPGRAQAHYNRGRQLGSWSFDKQSKERVYTDLLGNRHKGRTAQERFQIDQRNRINRKHVVLQQQHQQQIDHDPDLDPEYDIDVDDQSENLSQLALTQEKRFLCDWNMPNVIMNMYRAKGISTLFDWQIKALSLPNVFKGSRNLVYSTPTSGGKTLVAEVLMMQALMREKRILVVLPFVSLVAEKCKDLQEKIVPLGLCCKAFHSNVHPSWTAEIDVAVATIEKASILILNLICDKRMDELGLVIVDEVHMVADPHRGYLIELLLTKLRLACKRREGQGKSYPQIVCMSATAPNVDTLAHWLDAEPFQSSFRPVQLKSYYKVGNEIFSSDNHRLCRTMPQPPIHDSSGIIPLVREVVVEGNSVLVFAATKVWCKTLSEMLSKHIGIEVPPTLVNKRLLLLEELRHSPTGLSRELERSIPAGVAFHCTDITVQERAIIEEGFRNGILCCLVATSTLAAGVNLPARRVIFRSAFVGSKFLSPSAYQQMAGRAGRFGLDEYGESIVIHEKKQRTSTPITIDDIRQLVSATLAPIKSCLDDDARLGRMILEGICCGLVQDITGVFECVQCSLIAKQVGSAHKLHILIESALEFLLANRFVEKIDHESHQFKPEEEAAAAAIAMSDQDLANDDISINLRLLPTSLGRACSSSGLSLSDALVVFESLQKARTGIALKNSTMLAFLSSPVHNVLPINMEILEMAFGHMNADDVAVAKILEIDEFFLERSRYIYPNLADTSNPYMNLHRRFVLARLLTRIVSETPLPQIAAECKNRLSPGILQHLQMTASSMAGVLAVFCSFLRWDLLALLLAHFSERIGFGCASELVDLVRIEGVQTQRARALYEAGFDSVASIASSKVDVIATALTDALPYIGRGSMSLRRRQRRDAVARAAATQIYSSANRLVEEQEQDQEPSSEFQD